MVSRPWDNARALLSQRLIDACQPQRGNSVRICSATGKPQSDVLNSTQCSQLRIVSIEIFVKQLTLNCYFRNLIAMKRCSLVMDRIPARAWLIRQRATLPLVF